MSCVFLFLLSCTTAATPEVPGDWSAVRVGDRVRYRYLHQSDGRPPERAPTDWAATLSVEVAAVAPGWAWLRLAVRAPDGEPLDHQLLGRDLLLPVSTAASPHPPPEEPSRVDETSDVVTAAGRSWQTTRSVRDNRPGDGPLVTRHRAALEGALYLVDGHIRYEMVTAGWMAPTHTFQLELLDCGRGEPGAAGAVPEGVPLYAPPGAWYLSRSRDGDSASLTRGEVRGWRSEIATTAQSYFGQPDGRGDCLEVEGRRFCTHSRIPAHVETAHIFDVLHRLARLAERPWASGPPGVPAEARAGELTPRGRSSVITEELRLPLDTYVYAADPWDPALEDLAFEQRVQPLRQARQRFNGGEIVEDIVDWGTIPSTGASPRSR